MKYFYLLLTAILLPLFLSAQNNYKPGYIIDAKGDTVKGYIDYKEWDKNPAYINFKSAAGQIERVGPKNSAGFGVAGQEHYNSATVKISRNRVGLLNVYEVKDSSHITETVYLRTLTKGKYVTLYNYTDDIKSHFYAADGNQVPQELIYESNYSPGGDSPVQYNNRFRVQLQNIAQQHGVNAPKLEQLIVNSKYNKTDLIKIAQLINDNKTEVIKSQAGQRFLMGAGVNFSNFTNADNQSASSVFPELTGGVDLFLNKTTQSVFFRLALSFTADKFTVDTESPTSSPTLTRYTTSVIKHNIVSFNPQVIYNFYNAESLKAFIGLGVSLRYAASGSYINTVTYNNSSPATVVDNKAGLHNFWATLPTVKAGVAINKKIEIFAGYLAPSKITTNTSSETMTTYQAGINYYFGK